MILLLGLVLVLISPVRAQIQASPYITYVIGDPAPGPFVYQITTAEFYPLTGAISLSLTPPNGWLSASLSSPVVPSTLTLTINPVGVPVGTWSDVGATTPYVQCATVNSSNSVGPVAREQWCVYLTVITPTTPSITALGNAASFIQAPQSSNPTLLGSVSPGEIVSVFGTALGPTEPLSLQIDSKGNVGTSLGGFQVLFDGIPAPLLYVSSSQINCIVPYAFVPGMVPGNIVPIRIYNAGQPVSLVIPGIATGGGEQIMTPISTNPGIFTANGIGTGNAAALNSDNSVNSASNPATAGSTIQMFITGEGQTSPVGATGSVTCFSGCASAAAIPKLASTVSATIAGKAASVVFAGEAPGLVAGVAQVNIVVPPGTPSGPATLSITVGSGVSQPGVTVAVK